MGIIDQPVEVRKGEELDVAKVEKYLFAQMPGLKGPFEIRQFPSGFSNLTYLVRAGDREFILRRPPFGHKAKTAHDMSREYRMLTALRPVYPYCPNALLYCDDEEVMGSPFYVMERLTGIILRKDIPKEMNLSQEDAQRLCENLIQVQCDLHKVDYHRAGLADYGKPEGYVRRQVEGWSGRYRAARTPDAPDFEKVMQWLDGHQTKDSAHPGVIHNDYKFDNVVLDPDNGFRIKGVLDWEMATIGDPLMDLGSSLAYWVDRNDPEMMQAIRQMPTDSPGMLTRDEMVRLYSQMSGIKIDNFDFYYCFGLFRLAVIAQQIYYRFFHGQTKDQRFGMLVHAVKILEDTALRLIEKSDL